MSLLCWAMPRVRPETALRAMRCCLASLLLAGVVLLVLPSWAAAQGAAALLTVPGDTPFIPRGLAARLAPGSSCAETAGRPHWLVALWPVALRAELRDWLETGRPRRVEAFAGHAGVRRAVLTGAEELFLNVNPPADLAAARERLRDG